MRDYDNHNSNKNYNSNNSNRHSFDPYVCGCLLSYTDFSGIGEKDKRAQCRYVCVKRAVDAHVYVCMSVCASVRMDVGIYGFFLPKNPDSLNSVRSYRCRAWVGIRLVVRSMQLVQYIYSVL